MGKGKKLKRKSELREAIERERTGSQIYGAASYGYYINNPYPGEVIDKRKLRLMRHYPTITYLIQLITIAGDSAEWSVEADEGVRAGRAEGNGLTAGVFFANTGPICQKS